MKKIIMKNSGIIWGGFALFCVSFFFHLNSAIPINLVIVGLLLVLVLYFQFRNLSDTGCRLLHAMLLYIIMFATSYAVIYNGWPLYWVPFSVFPMLVTILFGQLELAFLLTLASAMTLMVISPAHTYYGILFFTTGMISSFLVFEARRRMEIIRTGFIVGLMQVVFLIFIEDGLTGRLFFPAFCFFLNGVVSSIIVLGVLPLFEYLFKTVTNISLLELADFYHPLLQKMILEAPGTYHHSLVVGNLSESACSAIGAHALLARVGSYYHDIGKLPKPEYFSENQSLQQISKHDALSPTISKMVIMNHIKDGVELAQKYRLNQRIIDFIQQHHGNSLVYYFYRRALENIEDSQDVHEEGFRYPGPKPRTKETAVVMLADSVEAATRSLREPTPKKIDEVVHKIINNKFIDGQLDECDLTLKDLEKIAAVFIRILTGIYHSRVTYPEGEPNSSH
jgi:putative nucleotidyltransferase with HDIG domain